MPSTLPTQSEYAGIVILEDDSEYTSDTKLRGLVTVLGDEASLRIWNPERYLYEQHDRLLGFEIEETDSVVLFTGKSDRLMNVIHVLPGQEQVKWMVTLRGCVSC